MKSFLRKIARKLLKKEILQKDSIILAKENYCEWIWCAEWLRGWKDYFFQNNLNIINKISLLKENLDEISINTIDFLINMNINQIPHNNFIKNCLYNKNIFLGFDKLKEKDDSIYSQEIHVNYKIPDEFQILEEPVWKFDNGLKFLDK